LACNGKIDSRLVRNSVHLAFESGFKSIALPLIGAGSGGYISGKSKSITLDELSKLYLPMIVKVVKFDDK